MNLAQLLVRAARTHPGRVAMMHGERALWTYAQLADRVARLAGHLRGTLALQAGDRVALVMHNHPQVLEALYAIWWAGLAAVPVNAKLHAKEVRFVLQDADAAALFASHDLLAPLRAEGEDLRALRAAFTPGDAAWKGALAAAPIEPQHRDADELAWLFYTSGTTGRPKGVMITHRNLLAMTCCYFIDVDEVAGDDVIVYAAPMSHGAGIYNFPFVARAARHLVPASGGFEPAELVALARQVGRLCLFAAPTMVKRLVDHVQANGGDGSGFKTIVYGGGPMYVQDIRHALEVMGPRFVQIYGQGESPMTITALSREQIADRDDARWLQRLASVGVAQSLVEVRVVDGEGRDLARGETGEVVVRGEPVMAGYWNNAAASAHALHDGWLWTGDLGAMDGEGFLTLKDRSKDVIISGGSNIYPREVEEVLLRHPGVREVAVVGETDAQWGENVVAFIVADASKGGTDEAALDALCLAQIARFKRPKRYVFVDALPKNNYGKVLKTALRERLAERAP